MRTSLLVTLLLISILISYAQGIRLNKGFQSQEDHKIQKCVETRTRGSGADLEAVKLKDDHISGDSRKLMAKATSIDPTTTSTTSKNDGNKPNTSQEKVGFGGKDASLSIHSTLGSEHQGSKTEQYPDTLDLAGMDYSPAKRKPPIHN